MTSISSTMPIFPMPQSPRARIDSKIAAAASAGTISQTDETALEAAVTSIGQSLRNPASSATAGTSGSTADASSTPSSSAGTSFKDKLDSLIDAQVTGGTLTDAQATELKGIFAQGPGQNGGGQDAAQSTSGTSGTASVAQTGQAGGTHHAHHHGGGGGGGIAAIMAALDGSDSTDSSTDTSAIDALTGTTSTGTTASTASTTSTAATTTTAATTATSNTDLAAQQLDKLIAFLEKMRASIGSSQTYGSSSASSSGTDAAGMVFSGIA